MAAQYRVGVIRAFDLQDGPKAGLLGGDVHAADTREQ